MSFPAPNVADRIATPGGQCVERVCCDMLTSACFHRAPKMPLSECARAVAQRIVRLELRS